MSLRHILYKNLFLKFVCAQDKNPGLTLFHFMTTSKGNIGFSIGRSDNHKFSETNAVWDLKFGKCRQLIKKMNISEY